MYDCIGLGGIVIVVIIEVWEVWFELFKCVVLF